LLKILETTLRKANLTTGHAKTRKTIQNDISLDIDMPIETVPEYFNKPPKDWNIRDYLKLARRDETTRQILSCWMKSLVAIINNGKSSQEEVERAVILKHLYKGVDSAYGRRWLAQEVRRKASGNTDSSPGPVSNVIHEASALLCESDNPIFLWVIDLDDLVIKSFFDNAEWQDIKNKLLPLPPVNESVLKSISNFIGLTTFDDLRDCAESSCYRLPHERYNSTKHFDAHWVHVIIGHVISLIQDSAGLLLCENLQEVWFDSNVWSASVNVCLLNMANQVLQRQNGHRTKSLQLERGLIEVAKKDGGSQSPKWIKDNAKIVRGLCAILNCLRDTVNHDKDTVGRLQVAGLIHAGLCFRVVRMSFLGNVLVKQQGPRRKVPNSIEDFQDTFLLIESLNVSKIVVHCERVVNEYLEKPNKDPFTNPSEYIQAKSREPTSL
ncbi:hypothetical protein RUND412_004106, partial [Rhizina undulata]